MRALIQRVTRASVALGPRVVGDIGPGLLVFLGVQRGDDEQRAHSMAARLLAYRVFADDSGRMNLDVRAAGGGVLLVSQFTLAADTTRGLRPGFASAAAPALAETLYDEVLQRLLAAHQPVASGVFGAAMQVSLINDGPVTFLLET
ncbi:MAG: D-tyrosyl-tRNA(Tyr) deacylase [Pseudomonadales bacterium]|nr:D-tyrosyl-tRNA(Tyr) deacylase [Pseudomonadales bacterium]